MSFGTLTFTSKGTTLQAKSQTGEPLHFTRIAMGDGVLGQTVVTSMNSLIHEVKSLSLNKMTAAPDGQMRLGAYFSNKNLAETFQWREIGVFANDPELGEILYCYGSAGATPENIPLQSGSDLLEKQVDVIVMIGSATNVSATINESLVYASKPEIESMIRKEGASPNRDTNIISDGTGNVKINGQVAWHAGNDGSGSGLDADKLDGIEASYIYQPTGAYIPIITCHGPLEIGQYLDFHKVGSTLDFDGRVDIDASSDLRYNNNLIWHSGKQGYNSGMRADWADKLAFVDRRGTNPSLLDYMNSNRNGLTLSLHVGQDFGLPVHILYHVQTIVAWHDYTGGAIQMAYGTDGSIFKRISVSPTAWGGWDSLNDANTVGGIAPVDLIRTSSEIYLSGAITNITANSKKIIGPSVTGLPLVDWFFGIKEEIDSASAILKIVQLNYPYSEFIKLKVNSVWTGWNKSYDSGNYGVMKYIGGNYVITDSDHGCILYNASAGGKTIYVPTGLKVGFECTYVENNAPGSYSVFAPSGAVGLISSDSKRTTNKASEMTYIKQFLNTTDYLLVGNLKA